MVRSSGGRSFQRRGAVMDMARWPTVLSCWPEYIHVYERVQNASKASHSEHL